MMLANVFITNMKQPFGAPLISKKKMSLSNEFAMCLCYELGKLTICLSEAKYFGALIMISQELIKVSLK